QMMEQSMQSFLMQKQQFQAQLVEIESALKELEKSKEAYKIVGNIMVSSNKEDLKNDLQKKKEMVELRIKTLEKQESQIKEKASSVQEEVMKELKEKKKD
ncbi:prefoldin subunit beta, partial [Candidatus Woesearchaeota archaeon]|nr:prefoldin subunit beta [Candidatus Woesearchaeota archaeon]